MVAKGYAQMHDIDYDKTFVHIAKMTMVRVVVVVAGRKRRLMHQIEVKNVFLQGDLEEEVYMV